MTPSAEKRILLGLTLDELTHEVMALGMPRFTGKQIAQWLYDKRVTSIDEMTNISKSNRELLMAHYEVGRSLPVKSELSKDGSTLWGTCGGSLYTREGQSYPLYLFASRV